MRHLALVAEPRATYRPTSAPRPEHGEQTLEDQVDRLAAVLTDHERLEGLDTEGLRARIRLAQRLEGLAAVATAQATEALSRGGGIREDGAPSVSAWLRANTGRSGREAARVVRLTSSLRDLPRTADALSDGRITAESADAVVRAARDATLGPPDAVDELLAPLAAELTPEQLRGEVRRRTQAADGASLVRDERRQHARRKVALWRRDDGMWDLSGRLPGEVGEAARTLLDVFDTPDPDDTPPEHRRRPEQRLADAFATAVSVTLDRAELPTDGGVARPHVSVVVDVATLDADLTDPDDPDRPVGPDDPSWASLPTGETAWGGTLSPQAARRLCCDANLSRVVTHGPSQVLDVGRATREWSAPQRRAIAVRDRSCRGPGCGRPIGWTQIHHLHWWRHGGHTNLDNGLALCHHCHRLVHDHGWHAQLDPTTAAVTWTTPDRRRTIVTHPRPPS